MGVDLVRVDLEVLNRYTVHTIGVGTHFCQGASDTI